MQLYLVRHAIAEVVTASGSDADRALTDEGRDKMTRAVRGLVEIGVTFDRILTSPLRRAKETAEILAEGLGGVEIGVAPELAAGASPQNVLDAAGAHAEADGLALVGHQPDLGQLASVLLSGSPSTCPLPFRKGAVACFEGEIVAGGRHRMELEWFVTPKQLRAIGRRGGKP